MDPMESIRQTYFQECEELLVALEEGLAALAAAEAGPDTINAVFRAVHSIKGGGGAFGFDALVAFSHKFETVLDDLRAGKLDARADLVKTLIRAGDVLADHVALARNGGVAADDFDRDIAAQLDALSGETGAAIADRGDEPDAFGFMPMKIDVTETAGAENARPAGRGRWHIRIAPHATLYAKANDPFLLLRELKSLGETTVVADLSRLPSFADFDPDGSYIAWDVTLEADVPRQAIEQVFEFVSGDCDLAISRAVDDVAEPASCDDALLAKFASLPEPSAAQSPAEDKKEFSSATLQSDGGPPKQTIRVDLDKIDRLVNLVGELVITQSMICQGVGEAQLGRNSFITNGLSELEHLTRELQESVMAIRTQPVKSVFQRMPRLVRELAAQTAKQVRLVVEGEGTEVDKTVIDRLSEPLTHMIRNAIDHGLETTEERLAAGKPAEGTVRLSAEHRGGRIAIEVTDDGRGIDRERVRAKAIERGLLSSAATLSDEETDNLIFVPGFSTASQVSNISGRGVGMDVVRRNILDLGGRVAIASTPQKGSRFSLTLPLTLAVLDGMIVSVGTQTFVLPLTHIVESLKPKRADIRAFGATHSLLHIRDSYVPLVRTGELLGVPDAARDPIDGVVILVESEGTGQLALAVDRIIGQQQVVIKSFESNYERIEGIAAATILGDGRVALILDVDGLVSRCRDAQPGGRFEALQAVGA